MNWSDLDWSPSHRVLRQFSGLCLLFMLSLAGWHRYQGQDVRAGIFFTLAIAIGPLGLVRPGAVRPLFVAWMVLAFPIGWVVSRLAIALMYYVVLMPFGLLFKLIGRDALCRRYEPQLASYWVQRPETIDVRRYFRPY
jgi:hypothetical protein